MSFAAPVYLWLLGVLVPVLGVFLLWAWRRKQAAVERFVGSRLRARLTIGVSTGRQLLKRGLLLAAVGALLLGLARPRWGFTEEETRASGLDIVVCIDTSRSMLATDVKPNRLTRAKLAAYDLVQAARSDRLGLVAFSGAAFIQCPLALDSEAFRQSVNALDTEVIPEPGSDFASALREARRAFREGSTAARTVVIISDGEDHEPGAVDAARDLFRAGIRVFTLGVGTAEGEILSTSDTYGNPVFVKDPDGNVVKSRLNDTLLKQLAQEGGGFYLPLQNSQTVATLYQRGLAPLPRGEFGGGKLRQWRERYQWPLALSLALLALEFILPEYPRVRRTGADAPPDDGAEAPAAAEPASVVAVKN